MRCSTWPSPRACSWSMPRGTAFDTSSSAKPLPSASHLTSASQSTVTPRGASSARVRHRRSLRADWLEGERPDAAVDWLLAAVRRAVRLGAFADALGYLDSLLDHAPDHRDALCLRAEALDALGQGGAPAAYAAAAAADDSAAADLRAKQALSQLKLGDFSGALHTVQSVDPVTLDGRLARALTLSGVAAIGLADPREAMRHAAESRRLALELGDPTALVAASWAQALAAHACGNLRESLRFDVRDTSSLPNLAIAVFDGQLCVTQRLLYGALGLPGRHRVRRLARR